MKQKSLMLTLTVMTVAGCSTYEGATRDTEYTSAANPASVYCVQQGGELKMLSENGERVTHCVFSEDESIEQWEYFRQHHQSSE
ncbi:DUF333 domain-containing protein [Vibrio mytili]|uniref:Hemolysin n=1 Tax=Vibrio mytili TaxID=50718 RepID=A0A0C3HPP0_9VIBR|nr:DUF333 domain-containing protein [Vibrio mytili]KIN10086.1 hemolysin [Vibrio mytili]